MIDVPHAPRDRRFHLLEGGVRMAGVTADTFGMAGADKRFRAGQLRSDRRGRNAVGECKVLLKLARLRSADRRGGMTAASFCREVGTVEMRAENASAAAA